MYYLKASSLFLVSLLGHTSVIRALPLSAGGGHCGLSQISIDAINRFNLTLPPPDQKLVSLVLGVGTQNYTCNSSGTFTSIGAVATLYNVSCISDFLNGLNSTELTESITPIQVAVNILQSGSNAPPARLGDHIFVANASGTPSGSLSPFFDFRAGLEKNNTKAFAMMSKTQNVKSPVDSTHDVDWLKLTAIPGNGDFAATAYRLFTLGGQPPASCTPNSPPITVPYAANYLFFK